MSDAAAREPRLARLAAYALVLAMAGLSAWSATRESATYDEPMHIGAGYAHLALGDFRLDIGAPPAAKLLSALAIRPLNPPLPLDSPAWRRGDPWVFGHRFVFAEGFGNRILLAARLPGIALGALLCLAVRAWAAELWGWRAGLLALFLTALNPELLAHSHYANSDFAIAFATTLFLWGAWRFAGNPSARNGAWAAGAFALAAVSKLSFPALVPMAAPLLVAAVWQRGRRAGRSGADRMARRLIRLGLATVAATWAVVWALHGFRYEAAVEAGLGQPLRLERMLPAGSRTRAALEVLRDRRLLPEAYVLGLGLVAATPEVPRQTFLAGEVREGGRYSYFPAVIALKTPIPLLLLAAVAALGLFGARRPSPPLAHWAITVPIAVYVAISIGFGLNIGYRHLLPVLPLAAVLAGGAATVPLNGRSARLAALVLAGWTAWGTLRIAPHFLSYFNELAGGALGGTRLLADSNCDWGQDFDELVRYLRRERAASVKLSYFGTGLHDVDGVELLLLPSVTSGSFPARMTDRIAAGDLLAVSVTNLRRVYFKDPDAFRMIVDLPGVESPIGFARLLEHLERDYRPVARAGYSIFVYRLTPEHRR